MNKAITAAIAAALALGSGAVAAKMYDLTAQERMEMRARADKLAAERSVATAPRKQEVTAIEQMAMPRAVSGKQELSQEERRELRSRAARLVEERPAAQDATHIK